MWNNWVKGHGHIHFDRDSPLAPKDVESIVFHSPAPPTINICGCLVPPHPDLQGPCSIELPLQGLSSLGLPRTMLTVISLGTFLSDS